VSFYLIVAIFIVGIWGLIAKDNLIKKIIGLNILNSGVVLFFIYIGSFQGTTAPIMEKGIKDVVDPIPQALMLTAIDWNLSYRSSSSFSLETLSEVQDFKYLSNRKNEQR